MYVFDLESEELSPFLTSNFDEISARLSPDGRWVAYQSNDSGRAELYVAPFPDRGGKWQISSEGIGTPAFWGEDGLALYYGTADGSKKRVELKASGEALEIGAPETLFEDPAIGFWTAEPGRDTYLALRSKEGALEAPLTIMTNWSAALDP